MTRQLTPFSLNAEYKQIFKIFGNDIIICSLEMPTLIEIQFK